MSSQTPGKTNPQSTFTDVTTERDAVEDVLRPRRDKRDIPIRARARMAVTRLVETSVTYRGDPEQLTTSQVIGRMQNGGPPDAHDEFDRLTDDGVWDAVRDVLQRMDRYGGDYRDHIDVEDAGGETNE